MVMVLRMLRFSIYFGADQLPGTGLVLTALKTSVGLSALGKSV